MKKTALTKKCANKPKCSYCLDLVFTAFLNPFFFKPLAPLGNRLRLADLGGEAFYSESRSDKFSAREKSQRKNILKSSINFLRKSLILSWPLVNSVNTELLTHFNVGLVTSPLQQLPNTWNFQPYTACFRQFKGEGIFNEYSRFWREYT